MKPTQQAREASKRFAQGRAGNILKTLTMKVVNKKPSIVY